MLNSFYFCGILIEKVRSFDDGERRYFDLSQMSDGVQLTCYCYTENQHLFEILDNADPGDELIASGGLKTTRWKKGGKVQTTTRAVIDTLTVLKYNVHKEGHSMEYLGEVE